MEIKDTSVAVRRFGSVEVTPAPARWRKPCANREWSLHQVSPYIGKIKSTIAGELIERFSKPGDLVVDPFAGAGTIPFEAALRGRRVLAADISPYAGILSRAKLSAPPSLGAALRLAELALREAAQLSTPDLRVVPTWVRRFDNDATCGAGRRSGPRPDTANSLSSPRV
jgi:hypothetical protein